MPFHAAGQLGGNNFGHKIGANKIPGWLVGVAKTRNGFKAVAAKPDVVAAVIREIDRTWSASNFSVIQPHQRPFGFAGDFYRASNASTNGGDGTNHKNATQQSHAHTVANSAATICGMPLLEVQALQKTYGHRRVVDQVSFHVDAGEIVGLLGRNGAGKTTSFRMAMGMITPESGQVFFHGQDVTYLPMWRHAKLGMGYLSQEPSVFQRLSVEENLLAILETISGLSSKDKFSRCDALLSQFGLQIKRKDQARTCSGGERRRLEIARALVTQPALILLDEPFAAVDPHTVEELQTEVRKLAKTGIAILVTDHNVQQTLRICDRAYIIHEGKNLREGSPKDIINDPMVRDAYLAGTFRGNEFD